MSAKNYADDIPSTIGLKIPSVPRRRPRQSKKPKLTDRKAHDLRAEARGLPCGLFCGRKVHSTQPHALRELREYGTYTVTSPVGEKASSQHRYNGYCRCARIPRGYRSVCRRPERSQCERGSTISVGLPANRTDRDHGQDGDSTASNDDPELSDTSRELKVFR